MEIKSTDTYKVFVVQVAKSPSPKSNYKDHKEFNHWSSAQSELLKQRRTQPFLRHRVLAKTFVKVAKLAKVEILK